MDPSLGRFLLPIEIIIMIFEEIHEDHDAIMLGLSHDTLMLIGWKHIRALVLQDIAPWAGGRIICFGAFGEDLPDGLISEEEQEELLRLNYEQEPSTTPLALIVPFNLHSIVFENFGGVTEHFEVSYQRLRGLSSKEQQILRQIIMETGYKWENGWVLMNLSAQEYVTSKAASRILRSMNPTDAGCFGQLILSRICWSTDCSTAIHFDGLLHRGVWAGDRFRIVTTEVFKTRTSGEKWKDVTVEATEWLKAIIQSDEEYQSKPYR